MLKKIIFIHLFLLPNILFAQYTYVDSIFVGNQYRTYRIYVPALYNSNNAVPLILNMHGRTSDAYAQEDYSNFKPIADTANFIMVYPQGTKDNIGRTFWNVSTNNGLVNDPAFLSALIDTIKLDYNIDNERVYATGFSLGGFMSHYLACNLNSKIAAAASVSGTFYINEFPYSPNKAVPILQIHGTNDAAVPYNGNSEYVSVNDAINFWVNNNLCASIPEIDTVLNSNTTDGSIAEHQIFRNYINGANVELYKVINGAHTWPGASNILDVTCLDFNASAEIWNFFRRYKLSNNPVGLKYNKDNIAIFPNPSSEVLNIAFNDSPSSKDLSIVNSQGQVVWTKTTANAMVCVDIKNYPKGFYYLQILNSNGKPRKYKFVVN